MTKHIPFKKDSKVAVLSSPSVFGEMAILSSLPRSATIIARENVVVMRFARRKFERLLEEGKLGAYKLALGMGTILSDRHRRLTEQVARLSQQVDDMEAAREGKGTNLFDRTDMFTIGDVDDAFVSNVNGSDGAFADTDEGVLYAYPLSRAYATAHTLCRLGGRLCPVSFDCIQQQD